MRHAGPSEKAEVSELVNGEPRGETGSTWSCRSFFIFIFLTTQVPAMKEDKKNNRRGNSLDQAK